MCRIVESIVKNIFFTTHSKVVYFYSLNGADIDMPEWMFSKMMRSAQIRFSDHSILRIVQILGKLGNWRRVLQVIEWIQSRERYKSHKIRYFLPTTVPTPFAPDIFYFIKIQIDNLCWRNFAL